MNLSDEDLVGMEARVGCVHPETARAEKTKSEPRIILPDCWETSDGLKRRGGGQREERRELLKIGTKRVGIQV